MPSASYGLLRPSGPLLSIGRLRRPAGRRSQRRLGRLSTGRSGWRLPAGPRLTRPLTILAVLLLARGLFWLLDSPRLGLHTFQVNGLRTLSAREVVVQSGLEGLNIFRARPVEAAERVTGLPGVRSATVSLRVPDFAVIEIVERQPIILWRSGEQLYGIDPEGLIVPPGGAWEGALTVVEAEARSLKMGSKIDIDVLRSALEIQARVAGIKTLEYSRDRGLVLHTPQGWPVYLGLADALGFKLAVLEGLLPELQAEGLAVQFIDLRLPTHPIVGRQAGG